MQLPLPEWAFPASDGLSIADLEGNQAAPAYLSSAVPWMAEHWRLYLIGRGRENFFGRTTMFNPDRRDVTTLPADSAVVVGASLAVDDLKLLRRVRRVTRVSELNGDLSF